MQDGDKTQLCSKDSTASATATGPDTKSGEDTVEGIKPTSPGETSKSIHAKGMVAKQQQLEQHRGSREMSEIIVETVIFTGQFVI